MTSTTLSDTGQATIPQEVRALLGFEPFDRIEFVTDANGVLSVQKAKLALEDVVGVIPALGLSDEEVKQITREAEAEHYAKKYGCATSATRTSSYAS